MRAAVHSGLARLGFLKGVGLARGCAYPARPASQRDIARYAAAQDAAEKAQTALESGAK